MRCLARKLARIPAGIGRFASYSTNQLCTLCSSVRQRKGPRCECLQEQITDHMGWSLQRTAVMLAQVLKPSDRWQVDSHPRSSQKGCAQIYVTTVLTKCPVLVSPACFMCGDYLVCISKSWTTSVGSQVVARLHLSTA